MKLHVVNGISFRVVNSPFFLDFIGSLNVDNNPAGRDHSHHTPACFIVSVLDCSSTRDDGKLRR